MLITVDLLELLLAFLIIVGVVAGILLIILLVRYLQTLKNISRFTSEIHDPITKTAEQLPALIGRLDLLTRDMSDLAISANEHMPVILKNARTITGTVSNGIEAIGSAAESVTSGVSSIFAPVKEHSGSISSIVDIVGQVAQIVSLFTDRDKPRKSKQSCGYRQNKKRRR